MHCAICWNNLSDNFLTIIISVPIISGTQFSKKRKFRIKSAGNQRLKSSLVGTSETTRATIYSNDKTISFYEWLAGIIDGDGSFQVSKKGYVSLEITIGLEDLPLLIYIKNVFGGSIKIRSGAKAYRYRLHNRIGIINLIYCINGYIRHSGRLSQFHRICQVFKIDVINPIILTINSNWFSGFFDADGTINISIKNSIPQLTISVTNKLLQDVEMYKVIFGGNIYYDSSQNGYYK